MSKPLVQTPDTPPVHSASMPYWVIASILLLLGLGLRLFHISEPPLDYQPERQYWDANRTRLLYYQGLPDVPEYKMAIVRANANQESTGPLIIESLAIVGYRMLGHESLILARGIVTVSYIIGGVFLFLLALRMFTPLAALVALAYYLFLPFAVQSTRTYQPDPMMTMFILGGLYFLYRYREQPTLKRMLTAGPFIIMALMLKPMAIFILGGAYLFLIPGQGWQGNTLSRAWAGFRRALWHPHTLGFMGFTVLGLLWYVLKLFAPQSMLSTQANMSFIPSLFFNSQWWIGLFRMLGVATLQFWAIGLGLLGVVYCTQPHARRLLLGAWLSYPFYLFFFNYHVQSHDYYNLPMVPIIALSLGALIAPATERFLSPAAPRLRAAGWWVCAGMLLVNIIVIGQSQIHPEFSMMVRTYEEIGANIDTSKRSAMLSEAYGDSLKYHGFVMGDAWPSRGDMYAEQIRGGAPKTTQQRLQTFLDGGYGYFIVTDFNEWSAQPDLQQLLINHFPVHYQGEHCVIFDLKQQTTPLPR